MADVAHLVGGDLQLSASGDILLVSGVEETKQRVLHRLLTSAGSYIWQTGYGAGLPAMVGQVASRQQIAAIIRTQMVLEPSVATTPAPTVQLVVGSLGDVTASIVYTDRTDSAAQTMTLSIGS